MLLVYLQRDMGWVEYKCMTYDEAYGMCSACRKSLTFRLYVYVSELWTVASQFFEWKMMKGWKGKQFLNSLWCDYFDH